MSNVLAVDIGGTKTLFQLADEQGQVLLQQRLDSQAFDTFEAILSAFVSREEIRGLPIAAACFAVAGPVTGRQGWVTNLPWQLDADELAERFGIEQVVLCNDFEAVGHGIAGLRDDEIETLQAGAPDLSGDAPRAVIGAGTGLGQAILVPQQGGWRVLPTEGGHVDFAPADRTQQLLLDHMRERFGHVSYDRLVSGSGLVTIFNFLRDYKQREETPELRVAMISNDPAAAISEFALQHDDWLAHEALDLFVSIYGAQAGNLALASLARGGVYLAGGIAAKNLAKFRQGNFMAAFIAKGRMQSLMETIPVHVVLQNEVGLIGARLLAQKAMYN